MTYTRLYTHQTVKFGAIEKIENAKYSVLGVPYDFTSTYRPGSRFGPSAIRDASQNLETYCLRNGIEIENLGINDVGDLDILEDVLGTLRRLQIVLNEMAKANFKTITLGGEHTITYGCSQAHEDAVILSFDAHMDLRNEYLGSKLSHATFMRRLCEKIGSDRIIEVGPRALCIEELEFAIKTKMKYITTPQIIHNGTKKTINEIRDIVSSYNKIYLTVDMDVLDPAYAPAVGNPVPEGLSPTILLDILQGICDKKTVGFDIVEVAPQFDSGITAIQATNIIFNLIAFMEKLS